MAVAVASLADAQAQRRARIEEYILRDAFGLVAINVGHIVGNTLKDAEERTPFDYENLATEMSSGLWSQLWPREEDCETEECLRAESRVAALTSAALMHLTSPEMQDVLREEAIRLARLAASHVADMEKVKP